jgi:hypothetical protein
MANLLFKFEGIYALSKLQIVPGTKHNRVLFFDLVGRKIRAIVITASACIEHMGVLQ